MLREELRRVEVEWRDSVSLPGWRSPDDVRHALLADDSLLHVSVGLLLHELEDRIVICLGAGVAADAEVGDAMAIPRAAITAVRNLRPKPSERG